MIFDRIRLDSFTHRENRRFGLFVFHPPAEGFLDGTIPFSSSPEPASPPSRNFACSSADGGLCLSALEMIVPVSCLSHDAFTSLSLNYRIKLILVGGIKWKKKYVSKKYMICLWQSGVKLKDRRKCQPKLPDERQENRNYKFFYG